MTGRFMKVGYGKSAASVASSTYTFVRDVGRLAGTFALFAIVRFVVNYIRNPLRKFPGPFLAGFTHYYRAYYDIWKDGGMLDHLRDLHHRYGPVVRITPNELHFASTDAYYDIYFVGSKFHKDVTLYKVAGRDDSSFGYADPAVAQKRRAILAPMVSRKAVLGVEDIIHEKIDKMIDRALSYHEKTGKPVNLYRGFRCVSQDIISQYAFGACFNTLESENFSHPMVESVKRSIHGVWLTRHFPWFQKALLYLGLRNVTGTRDMRNFIAAPLDVVFRQQNTPAFEAQKNKTVYHYLLTPQPKMGHVPPGRESCLDEGMTVVGAGGENTGSVSTVGIFMTYYQPEVLKRVQAELRTVWPDINGPAPRLEVLETLPFLTGCIKEALRFAVGAATPLPRDVGPNEVKIGGYTVPPHTVVGQAHSFMHENPNIFKNPEQFDPDRWCQPNSKDLDRYLVAFSRGPRQCLGMHLALGELYIMFAHTFRKLDVEIHNTTPNDLRFRQYFVPYFAGNEFHGKVKRVAT